MNYIRQNYNIFTELNAVMETMSIIKKHGVASVVNGANKMDIIKKYFQNAIEFYKEDIKQQEEKRELDADEFYLFSKRQDQSDVPTIKNGILNRTKFLLQDTQITYNEILKVQNYFVEKEKIDIEMQEQSKNQKQQNDLQKQCHYQKGDSIYDYSVDCTEEINPNSK